MEYGAYPHILSDREQKEWIVGCPVQVKRVKLKVKKAVYYKLIFESRSASATATVLRADIAARYGSGVK